MYCHGIVLDGTESDDESVPLRVVIHAVGLAIGGLVSRRWVVGVATRVWTIVGGGLAAALVLSACLSGSGTLGSTTNRLGRDPAKALPRFWLNISGPMVSKAIGDRYATSRCEPGELGCSVSGVNQEYRPDGYFTDVTLARVVPGQPLVIRAFDPAFVSTDDLCDLNLPSASTVPTLAQVAAAYPGDPDASARYAGGPTRYCTGDMEIEGPPPTTTFIVHAPDATPLDGTDNPIICAISFSPPSARSGRCWSTPTAPPTPPPSAPSITCRSAPCFARTCRSVRSRLTK